MDAAVLLQYVNFLFYRADYKWCYPVFVLIVIFCLFIAQSLKLFKIVFVKNVILSSKHLIVFISLKSILFDNNDNLL